jgi:hypothetical protein
MYMGTMIPMLVGVPIEEVPTVVLVVLDVVLVVLEAVLVVVDEYVVRELVVLVEVWLYVLWW